MRQILERLEKTQAEIIEQVKQNPESLLGNPLGIQTDMNHILPFDSSKKIYSRIKDFEKNKKKISHKAKVSDYYIFDETFFQKSLFDAAKFKHRYLKVCPRNHGYAYLKFTHDFLEYLRLYKKFNGTPTTGQALRDMGVKFWTSWLKFFRFLAIVGILIGILLLCMNGEWITTLFYILVPSLVFLYALLERNKSYRKIVDKTEADMKKLHDSKYNSNVERLKMLFNGTEGSDIEVSCDYIDFGFSKDAEFKSHFRALLKPAVELGANICFLTVLPEDRFLQSKPIECPSFNVRPLLERLQFRFRISEILIFYNKMVFIPKKWNQTSPEAILQIADDELEQFAESLTSATFLK